MLAASMPLRPSLRSGTLIQHRLCSTTKRFPQVDVVRYSQDADVSNITLNEPVVLHKRFTDIPVISKWFRPSPIGKGDQELNQSYLEPHGSTMVPLELTCREEQSERFERFQAPLSLLFSHITASQDLSTRLYLAQCSLEDLPGELRSDLPMPNMIPHMGKGDIYGSSLWMGRPPTYTPLHRDPNPNLFVQLAGKKIIRLMKPDVGRELYERVRAGSGHANMRGEEMMVGEESQRLDEAVWGDGAILEDTRAEGWQATLESGDGLYIPLGWWHSVRGVGSSVNASVSIEI